MECIASGLVPLNGTLGGLRGPIITLKASVRTYTLDTLDIGVFQYRIRLILNLHDKLQPSHSFKWSLLTQHKAGTVLCWPTTTTSKQLFFV